MKKNWLQIATLCVCAVLLVVTINQGRRLEEYQRQMQNDIDDVRRSITTEIQNISNSIEQELKEAECTISEYAFEPTGIDREARALLADVSVVVKEWYEDTEITLLVTTDGEERRVLMDSNGDGKYASQLTVPLERNFELYLDALISGGGMTKQETLGAWNEISMLLPLRTSGGGWSGPDYREGMLSSQFSITIEGQAGTPGPIIDPEFQIYQNGKLAQTLTAVIDPYSSSSIGACYTVDTEDNIWSMKCNIGDVVEVHFCCKDEYGLGYDFLFQTWSVDGVTPDNLNSAGGSSGSEALVLSWPE